MKNPMVRAHKLNRVGRGAVLALTALALALVCAGSPLVADEKPLPPPDTGAQEAKIKVKYSLWTDAQLELKRAQLKHWLVYTRQPDSSDSGDLSSALGDLAVTMKRHQVQQQVEEITIELLRRDRSGALIEKSNDML